MFINFNIMLFNKYSTFFTSFVMISEQYRRYYARYLIWKGQTRKLKKYVIYAQVCVSVMLF